jgi:hypothetical protein
MQKRKKLYIFKPMARSKKCSIFTVITLTLYANDFAKPVNPDLTLVFPFVQKDSGERGQGGGGGCEEGGSTVCLNTDSH